MGGYSNRNTIRYVGSKLCKESEEDWKIIMSWMRKSEGFLEERKVNGIRCNREVQDNIKGMHFLEFATKKPMFSSVKYFYMLGSQSHQINCSDLKRESEKRELRWTASIFISYSLAWGLACSRLSVGKC